MQVGGQYLLPVEFVVADTVREILLYPFICDHEDL